jgi:mRNA interferase MazF
LTDAELLAIIVNDDGVGILPLKVIVPVTEWKDRYAGAPWMVRQEPDAGNGLDKPSAADAFQIRSVAQVRFVRRLGRLSDTAMHGVTRALAIVLRVEL